MKVRFFIGGRGWARASERRILSNYIQFLIASKARPQRCIASIPVMVLVAGNLIDIDF